MSQSRAHSLIESIVNTIAGLAVSVLATAYVLPLFGVVLSLRDNIVATIVMTLVSVARQYAIRRAFNAVAATTSN